MAKTHLSAATLKIRKSDVEVPISNWRNWQDVFEHKDPRDNPLLIDPKRFRTFVSEYSVARTIRKGEIDGLRKALRSDGALDFLEDASGRKLDESEENLRHRFGTLNGARGIRSVLSKTAAFLRPAVFVAFDKYALIGIRRIRRHEIDEAKKKGEKLHASTAESINSYADYLRAMNDLLGGALGNRIKCACAGNYPSSASAKGDRFHRRVLDIYLSRIGERKF